AVTVSDPIHAMSCMLLSLMDHERNVFPAFHFVEMANRGTKRLRNSGTWCHPRLAGTDSPHLLGGGVEMRPQPRTVACLACGFSGEMIRLDCSYPLALAQA